MHDNCLASRTKHWKSCYPLGSLNFLTVITFIIVICIINWCGQRFIKFAFLCHSWLAVLCSILFFILENDDWLESVGLLRRIFSLKFFDYKQCTLFASWQWPIDCRAKKTTDARIVWRSPHLYGTTNAKPIFITWNAHKSATAACQHCFTINQNRAWISLSTPDTYARSPACTSLCKSFPSHLIWYRPVIIHLLDNFLSFFLFGLQKMINN